MIIALQSRANGRFVCADGAGDAPLIANRDHVAGWESFTAFAVIDGQLVPLEQVLGPAPTPRPPDPPSPPPVPVDPDRPPRTQFADWVAGKPFGQQTVLDLEPTLIKSGWLLTPPNAVGDRTKVHPPGGPWTRVGFGEGYWVWIPQDQ